jgi:hypothetical protein
LSELSSAVCSITKTQRRRFFWAAWWTGAPQHTPFRKPDAANGGAKTEREALADAERTAGRHLVVIEAYWARAWKCVLRGQPVPPLPEPSPRTAAKAEPPASAWSLLGLAPGARAADVKRAFHKKALETHPDQGGESAQFRAVLRAYERLTGKRPSRARKRR